MSGKRGLSPSGHPELRIFLAGDQVCMGVRVIPSAPQTGIRGLYGERLRISVTAAPEDNRANRQLVEALSGWLGLPRDRVHIQTGHGSRDKVVAFTGLGEAEVRSRVNALLRRDQPAGKERLGGS